jgi:hypothetical protein
MIARLAFFLGVFFLLSKMVTGGEPTPPPSPKTPGCCSWHGGVCGCSGARAKCCDGTLSPSCGC